ncbi:MAG: DUF2911 domain-containing protein [Vicinamibacterales bacterium]
MIRQFSVTLAAAILILPACRRDPGRDVKPLADPLRTAEAPPAAPHEIIPIEKVRKSQAAAVSQRIANTEITITYSRPVARGRELFGTLVPYEQVWNPGADQATAITVTRDVHVNDQVLAAGKYSVWAIPRAGVWTVIFSSAADVYHTPYPGESHDAIRLDVRPEAGPHMEALMFDFPIVEGKDATLRLHWGEVIVPLSIRVR